MRLPPFRIERFFAAREFTAPLLLCASDCEALTVADLLDLEAGAADALRRLPLGYTEPAGRLSLRREIAAQYTTLTPADILVHAGGEEAIFTFMNAVLEPADHVIVHHPSYQSLREIPAAIGCEVTLWETAPESGWRLDLDVLRDAIRDNTRVLVVNNPHSPTGFHMTRSEWHELFDVARAAGLVVFSDESYRGLEYETSQRLPAACDLDASACSLGLLSKGYGLPGLRIGWIATRHEGIRSRIARVKDYTTICSSAPSELLAEIALRHGETLLRRSREIILANRAAARSFFDRHADRFECVPPRAGPVCYPALVGDVGVEEFCERALAECGVLLLPGTVFSRRSRHFRVGLGRRNATRALERFEAWLTVEGGRS